MDFRALARFIGIIDMIFSVVGAIFLGFMFIYMAFITDKIIEDALNKSHLPDVSIDAINLYAVSNILWMGFKWVFLPSFLAVFASYNLIKATRPKVNRHEAVRRCAIWAGIKLVFLALLLLNCGSWFSGEKSTKEIFNELLIILAQIVGLCCVQRYIKQMH